MSFESIKSPFFKNKYCQSEKAETFHSPNLQSTPNLPTAKQFDFLLPELLICIYMCRKIGSHCIRFLELSLLLNAKV